MALDAAMLVAVTAAEVGAVHKLRTGTRRVEAQIRLLEVLGKGARRSQAAEHAKEAKAVERRLRRVRRAAGAVRDLDVQTELIRYDMPAKAAVHDGTPGHAVRKQAKALRKHLAAKRDGQAAGLIETLKAEERKLAARLHALEQALKPASAAAPPELHRQIGAWFTQQVQPLLPLKHVKRGAKDGADPAGDPRLAIEGMNGRALHAMRKAAKSARYMAESAPDDPRLRQAAERYEALQEAGGKWHDWLLLEQLSTAFHGRKAELTQRYGKHRDAALAEYRLRLADLLPLLMV